VSRSIPKRPEMVDLIAIELAFRGGSDLGAEEVGRCLAEIAAQQDEIREAGRECVSLRDRLAEIDRPETIDFLAAVKNEAAYQRSRSSLNADRVKTPADWFWLLGWLAGKAVHAAGTGDGEKQAHHIVTAAAACAQWHAALPPRSTAKGAPPPAHVAPAIPLSEAAAPASAIAPEPAAPATCAELSDRDLEIAEHVLYCLAIEPPPRGGRSALFDALKAIDGGIAHLAGETGAHAAYKHVQKLRGTFEDDDV